MATWPDTVVETPDGVRTTFTTSSGLSPVNEIVIVDRLPQIRGTDYTISGAVLTFLAGSLPQTSASILVYFLSTGASVGTPGLTTLGGIRATIRQRADLVGSQFITDAELNGWINSSIQELYDLLIQKYGDDYYVAEPYSFTTDGTDRYVLPSDLYKLVGVEVQTQTNVWSNVPRFNFQERNSGGIGGVPAVSGRTNLKYRLMGGKLWVRSGATNPSAGQAMRLWYAPRFSLLVADGDAFDGVSGWEEYVVVDGVVKCRLKGEEDPSVELMLKQSLRQRIEEAAENRDDAGPQTVTDVRGGGRYAEYFTAEGWD